MKQLILALMLMAIPVIGFTGFQVYYNTGTAMAGQPPLGDLSAMQTVVKDTISIADKGDLTAAEKRITDFEALWDQAEPTLRPMNKDAWSNVDGASDGALKSLRSKTPDATKIKASLSALLAALGDPSQPAK